MRNVNLHQADIQPIVKPENQSNIQLNIENNMISLLFYFEDLTIFPYFCHLLRTFVCDLCLIWCWWVTDTKSDLPV